MSSVLSTADSGFLLLVWPLCSLRGIWAQQQEGTQTYSKDCPRACNSPCFLLWCTMPLVCPFILPSHHGVGPWAYLPLSHLSIKVFSKVIRERGYFLGVGRFVGLCLFMQVLEGRFLSLEHRVAAGTNEPLVWGRVGDDLSHKPFRWDVLLLCKHIETNCA